ncbi:hypothetical protein ACFZDJ_10255 [Streptomyces sp. NPDC007896]|uniref:hypothetical protein n=1 Tax=unclassified Streptomyces TaxID=2593676 RepID=UPI0036EB9EDC
MNTTGASGLTLPQCCAHLTSSWGDGPFTAVAHVAAPTGLPARTRAPKPEPASEPTAFLLSASQAVGA